MTTDRLLMAWVLNVIAFLVALAGFLLCDDVFTRVALVACVVGVRVVLNDALDASDESP